MELKRSDFPIPKIRIGDRVTIRSERFVTPHREAEGVVRDIRDGKLTNDHICVGVEFDKQPHKIFYWYPFEVGVIS